MSGIVGTTKMPYRSTSPEHWGRWSQPSGRRAGANKTQALAGDNDAWGSAMCDSSQHQHSGCPAAYCAPETSSQHLRMPVDSVSSSMDAPSTHLRVGGPLQRGSKSRALSASMRK